MTLRSRRLTAEFAHPGELYTSSRFDWTTQLRQLTLDGRPLLTREKEGESSPAAQGWGLAGEFGIETPVGFDDCPVGSWFPKIGVGLLKRPDDKPYHFARPYEISPARFTVEQREASLTVTAEQRPERGYAWRLERLWTLEDEALSLATTLTNSGSLPLTTEEYNHNFFAFEPASARLTQPRGWDAAALAALVDEEELLSWNGSALTWTKPPTVDFFLSDPRPGSAGWSLVHPWGTVSESVDFAVSKFNVWGRGHVVSPELYRLIDVAPGASLTWTRRWSFEKRS